MKCLICGADVPTGRFVYCSDYCRKKAERERQCRRFKTPAEAVCPICGKMFAPKPCEKYCSDECRHEAQYLRNKFARLNRVKPAKPTAKCAHCGQEFTPRDPRNIYCSKPCAEAAHNLQREQARAERESLANEPVKPAPRKSDKSLAEWCKEARECNLDYGNYRALITSGKTFEELKAQAANCRVQIHAHGRVHPTH